MRARQSRNGQGTARKRWGWGGGGGGCALHGRCIESACPSSGRRAVRGRGTCDRDGCGRQGILCVVRIVCLVLARRVQVAVVLGSVVGVPRAHELRVARALLVASVERTRYALAVRAYFHIYVVGLGAPATGALRPSSGANLKHGRGPIARAPSVPAATADLVLVAPCNAETDGSGRPRWSLGFSAC